LRCNVAAYAALLDVHCTGHIVAAAAAGAFSVC
jgi:hypothetical protein